MAKHPLIALIPYMRDELAAHERALVARHIEGCAKCRDLRNSLDDVSAHLVRWIEQVPAPDPLVYRAQLARKLAARTTQRRLWLPRFAWVALAVAGASMIALILTLSLHSRQLVPSVDQLATETEISDAGIGLLCEYPVVSHLDLLENYDVIEQLNELPEIDNPQRAAPA